MAILALLWVAAVWVAIFDFVTPEGPRAWWRNLSVRSSGPSWLEVLGAFWKILWTGIFTLLGVVIFFKVLLYLI